MESRRNRLKCSRSEEKKRKEERTRTEGRKEGRKEGRRKEGRTRTEGRKEGSGFLFFLFSFLSCWLSVGFVKASEKKVQTMLY